MRIEIVPGLAIDDTELAISFILASGPGGQNVNKVATAAQLRFDARHSPNLPDEVKLRLQALAGSRLTNNGVIVMTARTERTQERNRAVVVQRLVDLIRRASVRPIRRRATKPTKGSKERRLEGKAKRADVKRNRGQPSDKE